jgi:hypothetical protein
MNWSLDDLTLAWLNVNSTSIDDLTLAWLNVNSTWIDHWVILPWPDWTYTVHKLIIRWSYPGLMERKQYINITLDDVTLAWLNVNSTWIDHWVILPWPDWMYTVHKLIIRWSYPVLIERKHYINYSLTLPWPHWTYTEHELIIRLTYPGLIERKQYMNWSLCDLTRAWWNVNRTWIDHWVILPWPDWTYTVHELIFGWSYPGLIERKQYMNWSLGDLTLAWWNVNSTRIDHLVILPWSDWT